MKFILVAFVAVVVSSPAISAECSYVSAFSQGSIVFNGTKAVLTPAEGSPVPCHVNMVDEGNNTIKCDGLDISDFTFSPATIDGTDQKELFVAWNHVWYRYCQ